MPKPTSNYDVAKTDTILPSSGQPNKQATSPLFRTRGVDLDELFNAEEFNYWADALGDHLDWLYDDYASKDHVDTKIAEAKAIIDTELGLRQKIDLNQRLSLGGSGVVEHTVTQDVNYSINANVASGSAGASFALNRIVLGTDAPVGTEVSINIVGPYPEFIYSSTLLAVELPFSDPADASSSVYLIDNTKHKQQFYGGTNGNDSVKLASGSGTLEGQLNFFRSIKFKYLGDIGSYTHTNLRTTAKTYAWEIVDKDATSNGLTPAGAILHTIVPVAPLGWTNADGSPLSIDCGLRDLLLDLGSPEGSSGGNPRVPNIQGYHIRGLNQSSSGLDLGRTMGDIQNDQVGHHRHIFKDRYHAEDGADGDLSGATNTESMPSGFNGGAGSGDSDVGNNTFLYTSQLTEYNSPTGTINENRVANKAFNTIIKL